MKEKRKHERFETEIPVTLRANGRLIPAATMNLSLSGICLLTDYSESIKKGNAEVVLDLSPDEPDIALRGKILRIEKEIGQKVAIEFTNIASEGRRSLDDFLLEMSAPRAQSSPRKRESD